MNIIAVDFDNTLALGNVELNNLQPNIPLINRLKQSGCYIKIVTARGSKNKLTYKQKVERYYEPIKAWLDKYEVPYNQISFNKEYAHLYIDDMTIDENADFSTIRSNFTNNSIILTEKSCIKKCKTAKAEFSWYKLAKKHGFEVPEVMFCNDELIITKKIHNHSKPKAEQIIEAVKAFAKAPKINNCNFKTYIENLKGFELPELKEHSATFYHGDFSTQNILVADKMYLIDPNYKDVFGSYIIDAAKAAFSFYAYENDIKSAQKIWTEFPESQVFTITEGMRVCKYRDYFNAVQTLRAKLNK
jgi:tRNA A-37 threonylcarbamoyl transferase component Bud32